MTDTARDVQSFEPANTEGLEDFFVPQTSPTQLSADQGLATPDQGQTIIVQALTTPDQGLTIDQAAEQLAVSPRTILRRLQKGSLPGIKVQGQYGLEWRVLPLTSSVQLSTDQGVATPSQGQSTIVQALTTPAHIESDLVDELRRQITELKNELDSKVSEAQKQIQAAAFRNGYLESQLENQRDQIKLLTDSQHKPSWWHRFKAFFVKQ